MIDGVIQTPLAPKQVAAIRHRMGLTQSELGELMGVDLRTWMRKEADPEDVKRSNDASVLNVGEANFLLLLADEHPVWQIKNYRMERLFTEVVRTPSTGEAVKALRLALGLKQQEIADMLGYKLSAWKAKQAPSKERKLKQGEYNFLMLLANEHPGLTLIKRTDKRNDDATIAKI